ncbi:putative tail fiber [Acinetobacter phage vB_AbaP_Acibel007]|uniref:Putative tail fiber n=1 Tax=Acinetobacter phage vB_AbaP_Acibel007 TaxID=1481187 RepID=A0A075DXN1_9CAUD|nr:tail protein [Acinetobacter phage vB_AbaP_Acibel007]AHY26817.1 putative tail fiber [Acinetobacter phage vB_AbaP_Acibel007]
MSFNEKLSYTEHVVESPTTDFAIGFKDYGEQSDTINVLVNDVIATEAGYTVFRKNALVIALEPAVTSGIVRLQRETNIDKSFHIFSAGAKFVGANMDANFEQILHSQQETRDGFDKLYSDVMPLVKGLEDALAQADAASQAAKEAAEAAEEAASQSRSASNVIDRTGLTQQDINDVLGVTTKLPAVWGRGTIPSILDRINIKDYGAIGDGTLHTLQEWVTSGRFSNLLAIQMVFPNATALTDSIDWLVTDYCLGLRKCIYAPRGTYVFNRPARTPHSGSPNRVDSGCSLIGDGTHTVFTRSDKRLATRIFKVDGSEDYEAYDDVNRDEAVFNVHGCYQIFRNFCISSSTIGFYLGQSASSAENSAVYMSQWSELQFKGVGTGMLFAAAYGNHYNRVNNIHFIECGIDVEMRGGKYDSSPTQANNNRNTFSNIRSNRSKVGLWCKSGDTNRFTTWDGEGCGATPTNNTFGAILGLPLNPDNVALTNGVFILHGKGQLNRLMNCVTEACDVELYNDHYRNSFTGVGFKENVYLGKTVINKQVPAYYQSPHTLFTPNFHSLVNLNTWAFPTVTSLGFTVKSLSFTNATGVTRTSRDNSSCYIDERLVDLGSVVASGIIEYILWADSDASSTANIEVTISADSAASNLGFASKFAVAAHRTSAKTLTRYSLHTMYSLRATGQGTGDSGGVTATVVHGGSSGRDLILRIQAPAYALSNVTATVRRQVTG